MDSPSDKGSRGGLGSQSDAVTASLGALAAEMLSAGPPRPQRLDTIVEQAIRFYLRPDAVEAGWAYPKFLAPEGGADSVVEVHVAGSLWRQLRAEAERQEVEQEDLLQHAAMYFAAARDGGRLTSRILEAIEGDAAAELGRRDDRRSA